MSLGLVVLAEKSLTRTSTPQSDDIKTRLMAVKLLRKENADPAESLPLYTNRRQQLSL